MANASQYHRANFFSDSGSTVASLDYGNGVVAQRSGVSYATRPTLQINYGQPTTLQQYHHHHQQQQQQGPAFSGRSSPIPVQSALQPAAPLLYPATQQSYTVYREERREGFFTTTIPRGSASGLLRQNEAIVVGQTTADKQGERYLTEDNQIAAYPTAGNQIAAYPSGGNQIAAASIAPGEILEQPVLLQATVEVHRERTSATTPESSSVSVINGEGRKVTRQNGETTTVGKSTVQQQRAKTPVQKTKKQAPVTKTGIAKTKHTQATSQTIRDEQFENHTQLLELDEGVRHKTSIPSSSEPKGVLVNDKFVSQVKAARQAQKGTKDQQPRKSKTTEKRGKPRKEIGTQVQVSQLGTGEEQTARVADKNKKSVGKKARPQKMSTQTQTETGDADGLERQILMNTAEVQTENLSPTHENGEEPSMVNNVGYASQEHVLWTTNATEAVDDIQERKETDGDVNRLVKDDDDSQSDSGESEATEVVLSKARDNHLYAHVIKPRGASSSVIVEDVEVVEREEPPTVPEKTSRSFEPIIVENEELTTANVPAGSVSDEAEIAPRIQPESTSNVAPHPDYCPYATLPEVSGQAEVDPQQEDDQISETRDQRETAEVTPPADNGEQESYRILRVAANRRERGEIDLYAEIGKSDEDVNGVGLAEIEMPTTTTPLPQAANGTKPKDKTPAPTLPAGFVINDSLKVYFHCCDITRLKTYVIVSATDGKLKHDYGVARAIVKAGGKDIESDGKKYVKKNGPVTVGDVVSTRPGKLQCAHVFHAVGPKYKDYSDKNECRAKLRQTYDKIFETCMMHRVPSVAIPLISTGRFGVPYQFIASCVYESVLAAAVNEHSKYPKEVHFVNLESAVILPVAVNLATGPAQLSDREVKVLPIDKLEIRDVLRERIIYKKSNSSSVLKKVKDMKRTSDARRSSNISKSSQAKR